MGLKLYFIASCRHSEQQIQLRQNYSPFVHVFVGGPCLQKIQWMLSCHKKGAKNWKLPWSFTLGGEGGLFVKNKKLITQQEQHFTLNLCTSISFNCHLPVRVDRLNSVVQSDTKKTGTFEKPNKNWRNSRKKFIDINWTITTCFLRDSNPNYQCLKITSCSWRPPPRMHSFTATTHFKSSLSFVSPCVCHMLCRIHILC